MTFCDKLMGALMVFDNRPGRGIQIRLLTLAKLDVSIGCVCLNSGKGAASRKEYRCEKHGKITRFHDRMPSFFGLRGHIQYLRTA
jgi:hypothetical protein